MAKPTQMVEGDFAGVRFDKMMAENSDDRARSLIRDIRVLAETLLKHAIQLFDPAFVRQPEATLGRMIEWIAARNVSGQAPYGDQVFGQLVAVKSSYPREFSQLSEPHHSVSETITVREASQSYQFWRETLFPAVHKVWEEYRFLQKSIVGDAGRNSSARELQSQTHPFPRPCRCPASDSRASVCVLGWTCCLCHPN